MDELVGTVAWQDVTVVVVVWRSGFEGVALSDFKSAWTWRWHVGAERRKSDFRLRHRRVGGCDSHRFVDADREHYSSPDSE